MTDNVDKLLEELGIRRASEIQPVPRQRTGILPLDLLTGGDGIPNGIIAIHGLYGTGKSTLCLAAAAAVLRSNPDAYALYIDTEGKADGKWFAKNAGDVAERLLVRSTNDASEISRTITNTVSKLSVRFIVIDSATAVIGPREAGAELGEIVIGSTALWLSVVLKRFGADLAATMPVLLVAQERAAISTSRYGRGEEHKMAGGFALPFYSKCVLCCYQVAMDEIGMRGGLVVTKNQVTWTVTDYKTRLEYEIGPNGLAFGTTTVLCALDPRIGVLRMAGSWVKYGDISIAQGVRAAGRVLDEDRDLANEILEKCYEAWNKNR